MRAPRLVSQIALLSKLLEHVVRRRCWQGLAGAKHTDAGLLREKTRFADWAKSDLLSGGFDFQGVAGLQVQFLAQGLGDYDSTGFNRYETGLSPKRIPNGLGSRRAECRPIFPLKSLSP